MSNFETKYSLDCWFKTLEYIGFELKSDTIHSRIYNEENKYGKKEIKSNLLLEIRIDKETHHIEIEKYKLIEEGALWTEKISVDVELFETHFKEEFRNTNIELIIGK